MVAHREKILLTFAALLAGCSTSMGSEDGGNLMTSGITEARNGTVKTQSGVDALSAGDQATGMADVSTGMDMVTQGIDDMRSGMDMMPSGMMTNCMDGGGAVMSEKLQQARSEMHEAHMTLTTGTSDSVSEGVARMNSGISMMNDALDDAQASIGCMGHSTMM